MVTAAKSKVGGAMYIAVYGTTLPTDAKTELAAAFTCMGSISEDGMTRSQSVDTTVIKDWGGTVVAVTNNGKVETLKCAFIDNTNLSMLKAIYGDSNVTQATKKITIKSGAVAPTANVYACDMILANGAVERIVAPAGYITDIGDITYVGTDIVKYDVTITCAADASGFSVYDYIEEK